MRSMLSFLPALACGAVMYVCMRSMSRSHPTGRDTREDETRGRPAALEQELEQEIVRLRAERESARRGDDQTLEV